jgi:hypothetical protein
LGSLYHGIGGGIRIDRKSLFEVVTKRFPELLEARSCPECGSVVRYGTDHSPSLTSYSYSENTVFDVIEHLYMKHQWSRQRIAEWLANRELEFKPSQTVPTANSTQLQEVGK